MNSLMLMAAAVVALIAAAVAMKTQPENPILMPSTSRGLDHQREWLRQVVDNTASVDASDPEALVSTSAGHSMQLKVQHENGFSVPTIVAEHAGRGLSVFYAGRAPLASGTLVGLYRVLMIRKDRFARLVMIAAMDSGSDVSEAFDFWQRYTIKLRSVVTHGAGEGASEDASVWLAIPVGERPGDAMRWFKPGALDDAQLALARDAYFRRLLVDWKTGRRDSRSGAILGSNAHLFNEPTGEEPDTVDSISGPTCDVTYGASVHACGVLLEARTKREVAPGEELVWCYGSTYKRAYAAGRACA